MLRIAVIALLASTTVASAQLFERRHPVTVFGPNGTITTISPTPGGFFATDSNGGMAMGTGNMITITPGLERRPMLPTLTPRTDSNFD